MPKLTEAAVNVFIPAVITIDVLGSTPPFLSYDEAQRKYLVGAHQRCCPGVEEIGAKCRHPKTSNSLALEDRTTSLLTLNGHVLHDSPCHKSHKAHHMSNGPSKVGTQLETESTHKGYRPQSILFSTHLFFSSSSNKRKTKIKHCWTSC